jgi:hypothetical protein
MIGKIVSNAVFGLAEKAFSKTPKKAKNIRNIGLALMGAAGVSATQEHSIEQENVILIIEAITALIGAITAFVAQLQQVKK